MSNYGKKGPEGGREQKTPTPKKDQKPSPKQEEVKAKPKTPTERPVDVRYKESIDKGLSHYTIKGMAPDTQERRDATEGIYPRKRGWAMIEDPSPIPKKD